MDFALATQQDESQLRSLLRTQPMPGWAQLSYEREPDFFRAAVIQGESQTIIARQGSQVVGMGCRAWREVYLNDKPAWVGYLSGLRSVESARSKLGLARGYAFLRQLHADGRVPGYLSTILEGNDAAVRLLTSQRAGLPVYHDLGRFITFAVPVGARCRMGGHGREPTIERVSRANFPQVVDFLNEHGRRRQFFPVVRAVEFGRSLWRGLEPEHFLIARNPDRSIAGVLAGWDQLAFKQTRVAGYGRGFSCWRWLCNAGLRVTGGMRLPEPGETLKLLYLALICIRGDRDDTFLGLLNAACQRWRSAGFSLLCCGFHERDPLAMAMKGGGVLRYVSRLYWVCWEDEAFAPIRAHLDKIPHLEVATL